MSWRRWFVQRINAEHERQRDANRDEPRADAGMPKDVRKFLEDAAVAGAGRTQKF